MKKLLLIILIFNFNLSFSQEIELIYEKEYEGAIFPKTYKLTYSNNLPNDKRFTPTKTEIQELESQLRIYLKEITTKKTNRGNENKPNIQRNLDKYVRQYIGFIDEKGQRIIHVNFIWNHYSFWNKIRGYEKPNDSWKSNWQFVLDGGSYYWNIDYIMTENDFENLNVNGVA